MAKRSRVLKIALIVGAVFLLLVAGVCASLLSAFSVTPTTMTPAGYLLFAVLIGGALALFWFAFRTKRGGS